MNQEEWKNRDIEFQDDENEEYVPDFEGNSPFVKNNKTSGNGNFKADKNLYSSKGMLIIHH